MRDTKSPQNCENPVPLSFLSLILPSSPFFPLSCPPLPSFSYCSHIFLLSIILFWSPFFTLSCHFLPSFPYPVLACLNLFLSPSLPFLILITSPFFPLSCSRIRSFPYPVPLSFFLLSCSHISLHYLIPEPLTCLYLFLSPNLPFLILFTSPFFPLSCSRIRSFPYPAPPPKKKLACSLERTYARADSCCFFTALLFIQRIYLYI